jgi:Uma2 family endonuclease
MAMLGSRELAVHFPVSAKVPESTRHLRLRTLLYQFLVHAFADVAMVGSDQFMYWEPNNPRACLSPDAFVRFGQKNEDFQSWKVWERGAPHVAVEIISDADASEASWQEKLEKYRRVGVSELLWFDPDTPEHPLRIWDFVGDDLLERRLLEPWAQSHLLGGYWRPIEQANGDLTLRLSRDEQGLVLFPTPEEHKDRLFRAEAEAHRVEAEAHRVEAEARRVEAEARRVEAEARRKAEAALRVAEERIAELEAERKRSS